MYRNKKVDPIVAATMRAAASQKNSNVIHYSLTVGQRVVTEVSYTPKTTGEYLRIKSNRGIEEGRTAITSELINDTETGCFGSISVDNKILTYGIQKFGRNIDYAWLRVNGRPVEQVWSAEGLNSLIAGISK